MAELVVDVVVVLKSKRVVSCEDFVVGEKEFIFSFVALAVTGLGICWVFAVAKCVVFVGLCDAFSCSSVVDDSCCVEDSVGVVAEVVDVCVFPTFVSICISSLVSITDVVCVYVCMFVELLGFSNAWLFVSF